MKRLIICCDGTWNNPAQEDNGVPAPTNVYKLYNAVADHDERHEVKQLKYYHPGLGNEDGRLRALLGGAFGAGISEHICSAYHWLADNYAEGDQIYLYGFSRGAFTVRSLAGFLAYGLPDLSNLSHEESWDRVHTLYKHVYRKKNQFLPGSARDGTFSIKVTRSRSASSASGIPSVPSASLMILKFSIFLTTSRSGSFTIPNSVSMSKQPATPWPLMKPAPVSV